MKKILLICALLFSVTMIKAQQFRFGITEGLNVSSPTGYNSQVGYNVGIKGEYMFGADEGFYIDLGISLSQKGWKSEWFYNQQIQQAKQWKTDAHYLNIPIHVGYKVPAGENISFFASVGPYFGIGLFGKYKYLLDKTETTIADNVFNKYMNRFDWGLGAKVGIECMKHFQVSVGYDWGLMKIRHDKLDSRNRNFSASVAYLF